MDETLGAVVLVAAHNKTLFRMIGSVRCRTSGIHVYYSKRNSIYKHIRRSPNRGLWTRERKGGRKEKVK
jgi:hypothetical protein